MPTPSEIITWHRDNYVSRLLARSPLLHFYPDVSQRQRIDVCDLFDSVLANAPALQKSNNNAITTPESLLQELFTKKTCNILGVETKKLAILEKISGQALDKKRMHGQHTLFVGYPLLFSTNQTSKSPILAPLFLIPVEIKINSRRVNINPIGEINPNLLLQQWAMLKQTPPISLDIEQATLDISNRTQQSISDVIQQAAKSALANWPIVENLNNINLAQIDRIPTKEQRKAWQDTHHPPTIINSASLGIVDFKGASILQSLKHLIEKANENNGLGIIDYFLNPVVMRQEATITEPPELDKYFVRDTDPFQEQIIWLCRDNNVTVIQGPPGTGKSQTIVNIIADALANKKKVGVFAQKRAALEIIHKRAVAEDFGELCLLIDDPQQDRSKIISAIKNIKQNWQNDTNLDRRRIQNSSDIQKLETAIESRLQAYRNPADGFSRYADIMSRLAKLKSPEWSRNTAWMSLCEAFRTRQPLDTTELQTLLSSYDSLVKQVIRCGYTGSPWKHHRTDLPFNLNSTQESLDQLLNYLNCQANDPERKLSGETALGWLATSAYFRSHKLGLFSQDQQDSRHRLEYAIHALEFLTSNLEHLNNDELLPKLWSGELDITYFDKLKSCLPQAGNVTQTRKKLFNEPVARILESNFLDYVQDWVSIVEACIYENLLNKLKSTYGAGFLSILDTQTDLEILKNNLISKQDEDRRFIRRIFSDRVSPRDFLESHNLLVEKRRANLKRTELRDLYCKGFHKFTKLHPVLLTTPDIACSILPMDQGLFDLVIIDEASQMFMAEAFPLLFRGKSIVIAGDSKQMPPTDFFSTAIIDNDDVDDMDDDIDDAISEEQRQLNIPAWGETCLLDAAENAVIGAPGRQLLEIHYRSESHELIEFSNHAFYEGKLQYPPSNPSRQTILKQPIEYEAVQGGNFNKGTNLQECKHIVRRLKELWSRPNPPTVGVIVLNVHQANLIEDELRSDRDLIDVLNVQSNRKDEDEDVGFFVRSVEHVQGDERDLIIFGTTYSGTQRNFGPLAVTNKGRRRLNVAITRAKKGMIVVSSLDIEAMAAPQDLGGGDGRFLQDFLCYAQAISKGNDAETVNQLLDKLNPNRKPKNPQQTYDSFFEQDVAEFLSQNNYDTVSQVGESGFRIDLAVKNRNGIGYLCGIECDGAQYHDGWKVRANDIWRQQVLESKGWKILRIWSTDWFNDCTLEKNRILDELKRLEAQNTFN